MVLFSMLNVAEMTDPRGLDPVSISNISSLAIISFCSAVPVLLLIYFCLTKKLWIEEKYQFKLGSFLEGVKVKKKDTRNAALAIPMIFCARRMTLALTLVYM